MLNGGIEMTIVSTWKEYNEISMQLSSELGRTENIVGEYGEHLINKYLNGNLLEPSSKSADIEKDGKLYQVKTRRVDEGTTTQLGIIRSWDFDYLAVILFDKHGMVQRAQIIPSSVAREIAVGNDYQSGYVITTNRNFFYCRRYKDITSAIKVLNGEVSPICPVLPIKSRTFSKLHRIEKWADNPENINHRIVKAYLLLLDKQSVITKNDLRDLCSDQESNLDLFVDKFDKNFNSMKTDAGNSHGKVFLEDGDSVLVFAQAMNEITKYFLS